MHRAAGDPAGGPTREVLHPTRYPMRSPARRPMRGPACGPMRRPARRTRVVPPGIRFRPCRRSVFPGFLAAALVLLLLVSAFQPSALRTSGLFASAFLRSGLLPSALAADRGDDGGSLTVSAAASLTDAFRELAARFEETYPGTKVALNLAGSGVLQVQIERGAPIDVFAAAAESPMRALVAKREVEPGDVRIFASNRLVLVVPENSGITDLQDLATSRVRRIALGNARTAPVGGYALQALRRAGLLPALEEKIVPAENVRQVLQYVETRAVDAGFVYATDARQGKSIRVVEPIDEALTGAILYPIAPVAGTPHRVAAERFVDLVTGEVGREVLSRYGFLPADGSPPVDAGPAPEADPAER
jgi:molybdate transport system substrate-binding protein